MATLSQSPAAQLALSIDARHRQPTGTPHQWLTLLGDHNPAPNEPIKTRHRPPQAVRSLRRHSRSPLHLRVFDHLRLIARTNRPPAAFAWNHVPADGVLIRSACEVDDLSLRIIQGFGITRDSTTGNVQEFRQRLRIRQEPSLHRAHGDPKAHTGCRVRQPLAAQDRRAILGRIERLVPIEIDEHEPRRTTCGVVVSTDIAFQAILPCLTYILWMWAPAWSTSFRTTGSSVCPSTTAETNTRLDVFTYPPTGQVDTSPRAGSRGSRCPPAEFHPPTDRVCPDGNSRM